MVPFFAHLEDKVSLLCGLEEEASFYDRIFRFVNFLWNTYVGLMAGVQAPTWRAGNVNLPTSNYFAGLSNLTCVDRICGSLFITQGVSMQWCSEIMHVSVQTAEINYIPIN